MPEVRETSHETSSLTTNVKLNKFRKRNMIRAFREIMVRIIQNDIGKQIVG